MTSQEEKEKEWNRYQNNYVYKQKADHISILRSLGWGISDTVTTSTVGIVTAWGLFFWTTYCHLTATQAASILALARVVDAINSLVIGNLTDKLYRFKIGRKFGRRHFFLLFGAPLILESLLFWIPGHTYIYYLLTYLCCEILVGFISIPWGSLPNEMTKKFSERAKMSTVRMTYVALFATAATYIQGQLFKVFPKSSPTSFLVNAAIFVMIAVISVLISYFSTWEKYINYDEYQMVLKEENSNIKTDSSFLAAASRAIRNYFSTFKIKSFRKHIGIYLLSFTAMDVWASVIVFYVVDVLQRSGTLAANIQALSIIGLPITIIAGYMMVKTTPRLLYIFSFVILIITSAVWWLLWALDGHSSSIVTLLYINGIIFMIGRYTLFFLPSSLENLMPDLDELVTGENRAGVFSAVVAFCRKSTVALATFLIGVFMDATGFINGKTVQPAGAQNGVVMLISVVVIILIGLALAIALTWKLDNRTHGIIVGEVRRLQKGGSVDDATDLVKKTCKQLTGIDYSRVKEVWKNYEVRDADK